jgi:hypothetical protein
MNAGLDSGFPVHRLCLDLLEVHPNMVLLGALSLLHLNHIFISRGEAPAS